MNLTIQERDIDFIKLKAMKKNEWGMEFTDTYETKTDWRIHKTRKHLSECFNGENVGWYQYTQCDYMHIFDPIKKMLYEIDWRFMKRLIDKKKIPMEYIEWLNHGKKCKGYLIKIDNIIDNNPWLVLPLCTSWPINVDKVPGLAASLPTQN